jgi:hypothetical protein
VDPTALDPAKAVPLLVGPAGAVVALLLFIGYLIREVGTARGERDKYMGRYEDMRAQRDEFRYLAGDAVRAGKRAAQTAVVLGAGDGRRGHQRAGALREDGDGE